jgi:type IV pilus assembly protein PilP
MGKIGTILVLILFVVFTGCAGEAPKPTKVPISPAGKKPATQAPAKEPGRAVAEVKAVEPPAPVAFTYDPQGKRNPFQPLVVEKPEAAPGAKKRVEQAAKPPGSGTPLENMDLAALKLVALVWSIPNPRAMVEDKGGKGYILTVGTRIGKNQGEVKNISSAGVVVREKYEDSEGRLKTREVPLRLYQD